MNNLLLFISFLLAQNVLAIGHSTKGLVQNIDTSASLNTTFSFIDEEIENTRIIALGEQTHSPDVSFKIRAKLIEYLIDKHKFEVVLFEAGMFDLHVANKLATQSNSIDSLKDGLYSFWSKTEQHNELFEFLQTKIQTDSQISFGGFDCKLTSPYGRSRAKYLRSLEKELKSIDAQTYQAEYAEYIAFWKEIEEDMKSGGIKSISFKMKENEKKRFLSLSHFFQEKLMENHKEYWAQMIQSVDESIVLYSEFSLAKALINRNSMLDLNNKRDSLMAQNLNFFLDEVYPDKKIILIGATYHFARNVNRLTPKKVSGLNMEKSITMGEILNDQGQEKIFVIGFMATENLDEIKPNSRLLLQQEDLAFDIAYHPIHKWSKTDENQIIKMINPKSETIHPEWKEVLDAVVTIKQKQKN